MGYEERCNSCGEAPLHMLGVRSALMESRGKRCLSCGETKKASKYPSSVGRICTKCKNATTKVCPCCTETKELCRFPSNRTKRLGVDTYCNDCANAKKRNTRASTPKSPVKYLKRFYEGHSSHLDYEAFMDRFLTDEKFMQIWDLYMQTNYAPEHSPRMFRVNKDRGYTLDNLMVWSRSGFKKFKEELTPYYRLYDKFKQRVRLV